MTALREAWTAPPTAPATDADRAAVVACVMDYFGGWFDGDAERMSRALHADLAKRSFGQESDRAAVLSNITAGEMVAATELGRGKARAGGRPPEVRIADLSGGIASVTVQSEHYIEYLHLVLTPAGWRIVNALWRWSDGHGPRA